MLAQARCLTLVTAHADIDVIALWKDPAVTASHDGKLEHHRVREARVVRKVRLECDTVHDLAAKVERTSRRTVATVGADHDARLHVLAIDAERIHTHVTMAASELLVASVSIHTVTLLDLRQTETKLRDVVTSMQRAEKGTG